LELAITNGLSQGTLWANKGLIKIMNNNANIGFMF